MREDAHIFLVSLIRRNLLMFNYKFLGFFPPRSIPLYPAAPLLLQRSSQRALRVCLLDCNP